MESRAGAVEQEPDVSCATSFSDILSRIPGGIAGRGRPTAQEACCVPLLLAGSGHCSFRIACESAI